LIVPFRSFCWENIWCISNAYSPSPENMYWYTPYTLLTSNQTIERPSSSSRFRSHKFLQQVNSVGSLFETWLELVTSPQCVKQSFRVSYQPLNLGGVEGGSAQRPPEALRRSRNFFFSYLVAISFPIEFDVWGRLCTHFEAAKVMTFAPVTQSDRFHSDRFHSVTLRKKTKLEKLFFVFGKEKQEGSWKRAERIQISHSTQGSRSRS